MTADHSQRSGRCATLYRQSRAEVLAYFGSPYPPTFALNSAHTVRHLYR